MSPTAREEAQTNPPVILGQGRVEPGTAAPVGGQPFVPEENFDRDLSPSLRLLVRGDKTNLINTTGKSDAEAIADLRVSLQQTLDGLPPEEELGQPAPPIIVVPPGGPERVEQRAKDAEYAKQYTEKELARLAQERKGPPAAARPPQAQQQAGMVTGQPPRPPGR
jgi:hypothetical protein